jgi:hypothetical protein
LKKIEFVAILAGMADHLQGKSLVLVLPSQFDSVHAVDSTTTMQPNGEI